MTSSKEILKEIFNQGAGLLTIKEFLKDFLKEFQ